VTVGAVRPLTRNAITQRGDDVKTYFPKFRPFRIFCPRYGAAAINLAKKATKPSYIIPIDPIS
jgi:hypothetical protein